MYKILSTCKGGGYMYCRTEPKHPKANSKGLYPLHRVTMENMLGRSLTDDEEVHHKDEDKSNNNESNLELLTGSAHTKKHMTLPELTIECPSCGKEFSIKAYVYKLRLNRNKSGLVFCSRQCGATV